MTGIRKAKQAPEREATTGALEAKPTTILPDPFEDDEPKIRISCPDAELRTRVAAGKASAGHRIGCPAGASIRVPLMTSVIVRVDHDAGSADFRVAVADPNLVYGIKLNRVACGKAENALTLKDGVVSNDVGKRPSEIQSGVSIPLITLTAIIAAPIDAIIGRTHRLKARKALLAAELDLVKGPNETVAGRLVAQEARRGTSEP